MYQRSTQELGIFRLADIRLPDGVVKETPPGSGGMIYKGGGTFVTGGGHGSVRCGAWSLLEVLGLEVVAGLVTGGAKVVAAVLVSFMW